MVGTNLDTLLMNNNFVVILSAHIESVSVYDIRLRNEMATVQLENDIKSTGLRYERIIGIYKGNEEVSFIVFCHDMYDVMRIEVMGLDRHNQESVLIVDNEKHIAVLKYKDSVSLIGAGLVQVDKEQALSCDNYSVIDDNYWVVK